MQQLGDGYPELLERHQAILRNGVRAARRRRGPDRGRLVLRGLPLGARGGRRRGRGSARRSRRTRGRRTRASASGWGSTPARARSAPGRTSASTCTARRGSRRRVTAGQILVSDSTRALVDRPRRGHAAGPREPPAQGPARGRADPPGRGPGRSTRSSRRSRRCRAGRTTCRPRRPRSSDATRSSRRSAARSSTRARGSSRSPVPAGSGRRGSRCRRRPSSRLGSSTACSSSTSSPIRDAGPAFEAVVRALGEARTDEPALEQLERSLATQARAAPARQPRAGDRGRRRRRRPDPAVPRGPRPRDEPRGAPRARRAARADPAARVCRRRPRRPRSCSRSDAVRLFLERARESEPAFDPSDEELARDRGDLRPPRRAAARDRARGRAAEPVLARRAARPPPRAGRRARPRRARPPRAPPHDSAARSRGATSSSNRRSRRSSASCRSSRARVPTPSRRWRRRPSVADAGDVLDTLESLADKSLVRSVATSAGAAAHDARDHPRVRGGASRARIALGGRRSSARTPSTSRRSRRAFRDRVHGAERAAALELVEAELDNLLASWRFWIAAGDLERLDMLLDALWVLHDARGWYHGAVELTNGLLDVAQPRARPRPSARSRRSPSGRASRAA